MDSDNKKISQLTRVTSLNDSDLFVVTIDPGTTPLTRAIKKSEIYAFGTYTPTLDNSLNVAASSVLGPFTYCKVGSIVTVAGALSVDPTAGGSVFLGITLPIASNFADGLGASGNGSSIAGDAFGNIVSDSANDWVSLTFTAVDLASRNWRIIFQYIII